MSTQGSLVNPEALVHDGLVGQAPVPGGGQAEAAVHLAHFLLVAAVAGISEVTVDCGNLVLLILGRKYGIVVVLQ